MRLLSLVIASATAVACSPPARMDEVQRKTDWHTYQWPNQPAVDAGAPDAGAPAPDAGVIGCSSTDNRGEYFATDLGGPEGTSSGATAINGSGLIAGDEFLLINPSAHRGYFILEGASRTGLTSTCEFGQLAAMNATGDLVGSCITQAGTTPVLRRRSTSWLAERPFFDDCNDGTANGINDQGLIAGSSSGWPGHSGCDVMHAIVSDRGAIRDLGTLGGATSTAAAINDAGQVAGSAELPNGYMHAFISGPAGLTDLGTLGGANSFGGAINSKGHVVGVAVTSTGWWRAFLWDGYGMRDLGSSLGPESVAFAVSSHDVAVGRSQTMGGGSSATLFRDGQALNLYGMIGASRFQLVEARGINDRGQIVGWGYCDSVAHAFLLTPR
jgi:probable HAF family extracellular repeat protein